MPLITPKLISCDEAGFTGDHMLDGDQRHFAYATHDLSLAEAQALLTEARNRFPVQMPELKAHKLLKSSRGRKLLEFVTEQIDGRYIVTLYDKRLALCYKIFEYIYEPVLQENSLLFYENGLHKFVGMFLYIHLIAASADMDVLATEFEAYMRSLDPGVAPTLLGFEHDGDSMDPLAMIRRFARGYNVKIAQETLSLRKAREKGLWMLDLTTAAVFSHLVAWGQRYPLIEVTCDESKPLLALSDFYDVMINRLDRPTIKLMGKTRHYAWTMSRPLSFASSSLHAGVQLADLLAGCTAAAPKVSTNQELRLIASRVGVHLHEECIMPNMDHADISNDDAAVNFLVLEELAQRADRGDDPLAFMEEIYSEARASLPEFRAGEFK